MLKPCLLFIFGCSQFTQCTIQITFFVLNNHYSVQEEHRRKDCKLVKDNYIHQFVRYLVTFFSCHIWFGFIMVGRTTKYCLLLGMFNVTAVGGILRVMSINFNVVCLRITVRHSIRNRDSNLLPRMVDHAQNGIGRVDKSTVVTVFTDSILEDAPCLINTIEHKYKSHPLEGFIRSFYCPA